MKLVNGRDIEDLKKRIQEKEVYLDKIRGCFIGGSVGNALGYAIEFQNE